MAEPIYFVQNTWTWHGTDDFLELRFSKELEGLAALGGLNPYG
jgi:hypothetical protein